MRKINLGVLVLAMLLTILSNAVPVFQQKVFASAKIGKSDCQCSSPSMKNNTSPAIPQVRETKEMKQLGSDHISYLTNQMTERLNKEQDSLYTGADFSWENAVFVTYTSETAHGLFTSLRSRLSKAICKEYF